MIAVIKDVPDVGGDRVYEIKTLSVRLGAATVCPACPHSLPPSPTLHFLCLGAPAGPTASLL